MSQRLYDLPRPGIYAKLGFHGPPMGPPYGLWVGCGLALITQDPYGLGPGSESLTHSWVVSKTNQEYRGEFVDHAMIESFAVEQLVMMSLSCTVIDVVT
jgi:hypothetical protein